MKCGFAEGRSTIGFVGRPLRLLFLRFTRRGACPAVSFSGASFFASAAFIRVFNVDVALRSFSSRLDSHSASRSSAICFMVLPVVGDSFLHLLETRFAPEPH